MTSADAGAPRDGAGRAPVLSRRTAVGSAVVLGGASLLTGTAVWVRSTTSSAIEADVPVAVPGTVAAPGVNAGGLVILAAAGALALGGRVGRRVAAVVLALGGALVAVPAVGGLLDPRAAALSAAQAAVGVAQVHGPVTTSFAPWLAVVLGGAAVVLGVWCLVAAGAWSATGARHERAGAVRAGSAAPSASDGVGGRAHDHLVAQETVPGDTRAPGEGEGEHDSHDAWDALTRGEDPT